MNTNLYSDFSDEKVITLNKFIIEQQKNIIKNSEIFHPSYLKGFNHLFGNGIFNQMDFLSKLKEINWEIRLVDGYLTGYEYFSNLNNQVLPVIRSIRPKEQILYAEFPDMIHDIMGHAPMLFDFSYVSFLKQLSELLINVKMKPIDIEYLSLHKNTKMELEEVKDEIDVLERQLKKEPTLFYQINNIALWTIEFGILGKKEPYACYGAALVGSPLEIENIILGNTEIYNLNNLSTGTDFNFSNLQEHFFTTECMEDVIVYINKINDDNINAS